MIPISVLKFRYDATSMGKFGLESLVVEWNVDFGGVERKPVWTELWRPRIPDIVTACFCLT